MTSYKFLQYNTDALRLGWDTLEKASSGVDFLLLQRFPKEKQKIIIVMICLILLILDKKKK